MKHRLSVASDGQTFNCTCGQLHTKSKDEAWQHVRTLQISPNAHQQFIGAAVIGGLLLLAVLAIFVFHLFGP